VIPGWTGRVAIGEPNARLVVQQVAPGENSAASRSFAPSLPSANVEVQACQASKVQLSPARPGPARPGPARWDQEGGGRLAR
jgi:hypothetical protein